MAIGYNAMRRLCGPTWKPLEVHLRHAPPANVRPWRQFFQAPVVFNAERTALVFQARWLAARVPGAAAQLHREAGDAAELVDRLHPAGELFAFEFILRVAHEHPVADQVLRPECPYN